MSRKPPGGGEIACHMTGPTRVSPVGSEHECFAFWISRAASGAWVAEGSNWCSAGCVNDDLCGRDDILAHDALPGRPNRPVGVTWGGCIHAITSAFNNRKEDVELIDFEVDAVGITDLLGEGVQDDLWSLP